MVYSRERTVVGYARLESWICVLAAIRQFVAVSCHPYAQFYAMETVMRKTFLSNTDWLLEVSEPDLTDHGPIKENEHFHKHKLSPINENV
jgi:hypothetical protein